MHVDTIRSIFKFDPYLTFIDPSQECPGVSSGTPKLKMFSMYLGIQKHFQTFVPRNWSRDLQAGPLLQVQNHNVNTTQKLPVLHAISVSLGISSHKYPTTMISRHEVSHSRARFWQQNAYFRIIHSWWIFAHSWFYKPPKNFLCQVYV